MFFYYWSNKESWHHDLLLVVKADNILVADKVFEEETGVNPMKNSWIGCVIKKP